MAIDQIHNIVVLSEDLATAGQPTADQIRDVAEAGYKVVINLDQPDSRYALPTEPALVQTLGMAYHNIAVDFAAPTLDDFQRFTEIMDTYADRKIFVHCAANYRVSIFAALYGQSRWGWSQTQADIHIRRLWQPNQVWTEFIDTTRKALDLDTPVPGDEA